MAAAMRVGVGPAGVPAMRRTSDNERFVAFVQRAEQLGYASVCVGDHLDERGAPLVLLTAAAMHTRRLILAVHVLCNELRNAIVLGHEARTVQALSGGRLELGLGTGWLQKDFDAAGVPMAPFRERLARLEPAVAQIRATAVGPDISPPPIVLGGGGEQMLATAARLADIVTVNIPLRSGAGLASNTVASGTRESFDRRVRIVRDAAAAAGRDPELHVYVHNVHLGDRWRADAQSAAAAIGLDVEDYVASPHVLAGDVEHIVASALARRDELGIGYFSIPGTWLEEFAPVVARLREVS